MADLPLFDDSPPPRPEPVRRPADDPFGERLHEETVPNYEDATGPRTYGVSELNVAIGNALNKSFPREVWVRGEVQGLARNRNKPNWYFELVEKDPRAHAPRASISVTMLSGNKVRVLRELREKGIELRDNMEIRVRGRVDFYPAFGKLQIKISRIDPEFTLGKMAIQREQVLRALKAEGLLDRNGQLEVPVAPLRVGLVTSEGSAAYNDFVTEIQRSPYAFRVSFVDTRVQGASTGPMVIHALQALTRRHCDVIVLARGGGARSDLSWFDSERIARAIAACPIPVWTGIGHEIDQSVADVVAHTHFKTPTACAAALVHRVDEFHRGLLERWDRIAALGARAVQNEIDRLRQVAQRGAVHVRRGLVQRVQTVDHAQQRLRREARRTGDRRGERLGTLAASVARAAHGRWNQENRNLDRYRKRFTVERLTVAVTRRTKDLAALASRVAANDPRRVLARGYSIVYDRDGNVVKSAGRLRSGDSIWVQTGEGALRGTVDDPQSDLPEPKGKESP